MLTWTNACFTEQSFGERSKTRSLPDQALVLSVRAAECIMRGGAARCHIGGDTSMLLISCLVGGQAAKRCRSYVYHDRKADCDESVMVPHPPFGRRSTARVFEREIARLNTTQQFYVRTIPAVTLEAMRQLEANARDNKGRSLTRPAASCVQRFQPLTSASPHHNALFSLAVAGSTRERLASCLLDEGVYCLHQRTSCVGSVRVRLLYPPFSS
jgi:hypothetical protein